MALPEFRAVGTKAVGTTGEVEVAAPAGIATGDLELLVATTIAGGTVTIPSAGGGAWTAVAETPIDVTGGEKLYAWTRVRAGGDGNPKVKAATDHICATRFAWVAGSFDTSDPLEVEKSGTEVTSDTSFSFAPGNETAGVDRVCVVICSSGVDSDTGQAGTNTANTSLTAVNMRAEPNTKEGGGGGFWLADGYRAAAGTVGTWTQTMTSASPKAYVSFAIKPIVVNSRYKLNEAAGSVAEDDLGGADGEYFGSPALNQAGITKSGDACPSFDGVDDRIALPDLIRTWTGFTAKLWVQPTALLFHQLWGWAGSTAAPGAWLTEAGKIKADMAAAEGGTVTLEATSSYNAEDLLCIQVTYASGRFRLYVNGVKEKESTTPKGTITAGAGIIGVNNALSSGWLKGKLAYFELYDKELSEAEILEEFEAEKPSAEAKEHKLELEDKAAISETRGAADAMQRAETQAVTDTITRAVKKALGDQTALTESQVRAVVKALTETQIVTESAAKAVARVVAETLAPAETRTVKPGKVLSDAQSASDARTAAIGKAIAEVQAVTEALSKALTHVLADNQTVIESSSRRPGVSRSDTQTVTESSSRQPGVSRSDTQAVSDGLLRAAALSRADVLALADELETDLARLLALSREDTVAFADALVRAARLTLSDPLSLTEAIARRIGVHPEDVLAVTDGRALVLVRALADALTVGDSAARRTAMVLSETLVLIDQIDAGGVLTMALDDALGFIDSRQVTVAKVVSDPVGLADGLENQITLGLLDSLTLSEVLLRPCGFTLGFFDGIAFVDSASAATAADTPAVPPFARASGGRAALGTAGLGRAVPGFANSSR
jgi:hypothetical protein